MSFLARLFSKPLANENSWLRKKLRAANRRFSSIVAANVGKGAGAWSGMPSEEDAANKEYLRALSEVQERAQDLDVNNPDVRGFHRARVGQVAGDGISFKSSPHPEEVGLTPEELAPITAKLNRVRELHSRMGGFDSTGKGRSEGTQQVRALLTAMILGECLIHRVWSVDSEFKLPLSIELIPGSRISTPNNKQGDPKISFGVEYSDEHRTKVVAYHVRRVSKTVGNSFIPDFTWDRLPIEDCSLMSLTEMAGIDRSLPLSVANVRMLRNRGEMMEAMVESARAQSNIFAAIECAEGSDPFEAAQDEADETDDSEAKPMGFMRLGNGVQAMFVRKGEKVNWNSAKLPDPDFKGFMDVGDERLARGFSASKSRFTRVVNSSWAGGRLEDQQDDPIIDQYRDVVVSCWQKVNGWVLDAAWLSGAVELPGYSPATRAYWTEFTAVFPGKLHINPVDIMTAREKGFALRTLTPQQACEEDGKDLEGNLKQFAEALRLQRKIEKDYGLESGDLDFVLSGTDPSVKEEEVPPQGAVKPGSRATSEVKKQAARGGIRNFFRLRASA